VVLEVNAVPAWRGLQSVIDADLTDAVAREVERAAFSAQSSQTVGECDSPPLPKE